MYILHLVIIINNSLFKSTLRFGRRKTIVHRTMCALPEAISAGGLSYTQEITFSAYTKNSLKVFLSDCFLFSAIFSFPRCFDMKIMSAARLLQLHLLQHKCIHHYKVAQASSHHEQMKNLMASKIFMLTVKNRKFQCIDHSADCINDSAC